MIHHWSKINEIQDLQITTAAPSNRSFYHSLKNNNFPILVQFPVSCITHINKNWITLNISTQEKILKSFIDKLNDILNKTKLNIEKKYSEKIEWDNRLDMNFSKTIKINARASHKCIIFNTSKEQLNISMHGLLDKFVDYIIQISQIQVVKPLDEHILYGNVIFDLIQLRCHDTIPVELSNFSFVDSVKQNPKINEISDLKYDSKPKWAHEDYKKYFDMLKMGVPRKAVEQKIENDGYDVCILEGKMSTKTKNTIHSLDFSSCKLKKTEIVKKKSNKSMGFNLGISFEDIQESIRKLRKTHLISI